MALTWTIDSTDKSSAVRAEDWVLVECAFRGQVGAGTIHIDDASAAYEPPAQKAITVGESDASPARVFTGYIGERTSVGSGLAPGERQWMVTVEDVNVLIDDRIITGSDGNRPEETDAERILWLISDSAMTGVTTGHIPNTNTVNMDAIDYRGKRPRDVLEDCAQKSGKNFFVYRHNTGPLLFYDLDTGTNLASTAKISDVASNVDNATVFAPLAVTRTKDPGRVYSKVRLRYKGGSKTVSNATTASTYRTREVYKRYMRIKSAARATEQANKWLDQAANERETLALSVILPAAYVNDIRAGMRIQVKLTRHGISSYTYYRIVQRDVKPLNDVQYLVELRFADTVRPDKYGVPGGEDSEEEMSNATEDDATVVIDSGGITVTGGSITVTNEDGVVVIDGSSQMFNIVASLTVPIKRNLKRGDVRKRIWVRTGLNNDPVTIWSMKRPGADGTWAQVLPLTVHSLSGYIMEYYGGRARYRRKDGKDGTDVQAIKGSTRPPLEAAIYRVRILRQSAI